MPPKNGPRHHLNHRNWIDFELKPLKMHSFRFCTATAERIRRAMSNTFGGGCAKAKGMPFQRFEVTINAIWMV
jgi:hypothetical protein